MEQAGKLPFQLAKRLSILAVGGIYVTALLLSYRYVDSELFAYFGLTYQPQAPWFFVSIVMALFPCLWLPRELKRPSQATYWILYITVIVPAMIVPMQTLSRDPYDILTFNLVLLSAFWILGLVYCLPRIKIPRPVVSQEHVMLGVAVAIIGFSLIVWATNGFRIELSLTEIYDRRLASREVIRAGSFIGYIQGNLASALVPFGLAAGIVLRSKLLIIASIFATVVIFSVEGSRSAAALPLFMLLLLPFVTRMKSRFGIAAPTLVAALIVVSTVIYLTLGNYVMSALLSWRILLIKGLLSGYYWEYFSANGHTLLSDGILRSVIEPQHSMPASRLIGLEYFGNVDTSANANVWAAAFGDFGYAGMLAATVCLGGLFRFLDSLACNRNFVVLALLAGFIGLKLSDVSLDSAILSHGVLLTAILLYFLPEDSSNKRSQSKDATT